MNKHAMAVLALLLAVGAGNALAVTVTVNLLDSHNNGISGGTVKWNDGSWHDVPGTTVGGILTFDISNPSYQSVVVTYHQTSMTKTRAQVEAASNSPVYQTIDAGIRLIDHAGVGLAGGVVEQGQGSWITIGTTAADGSITWEVFPTSGTYQYKVTINYSNTSGFFPVPGVVFQTGAVKRDNVYSGTISASIGGGWRTLWPSPGTSVELFAGTYSFTYSPVPAGGSPEAVTVVTGQTKIIPWGGTVTTYTVTFDANGGTGSMSSQSANTTTALTPNAFTRPGYTFTGWNTAANGSGTSYANGANYTFTANITLYAQWAINQYTVTFDANGGTGTMIPQSANYNTPTALTTNAFTRTGYTFAGWNTAANGSGTSYANGANYDFTANITLYAQWAINSYTVTFDANGGTGSMSSQSANYNVATNLTSNTFTRTGYTFAGWNTVAVGGGTAYADGASYPFTASVTLYAQWTINSYTVTYTAGSGGTIVGSASQTVNYNANGTLVTATPNPGYQFVDWNDASTANPRTDLNVTGNISVTANFIQSPPTCQSPSVISGPGNQTVCAGSSVSFSASANGDPSPTVQWQVSTDNGQSFADISGKTNTTLAFAASSSDNGKKYRAVFTNNCGNAISDAASLTVNAAPVVTTNPVSQTVCGGSSVSFTVAASGTPVPTVQWQVSTNSGGTWSDIAGATSSPYTFTATISQSGFQYRAKFHNTCGDACSNAATLTVPSATLYIYSALHTTGIGSKPPSTKTALSVELKVFNKAAVGSMDPKDFGQVWNGPTPPALTAVVISSGISVAYGGGQARMYTICAPAGGSYLVIGKAMVDGQPVYVGSPTDQLAAGGSTQKYLQVIKNAAGKILPATTTEVPGSLLLIIEPAYLEFTSDQELLPIVYESVEGVWNAMLQADPPEGFISNPGALSTEVIDSSLKALQFTIRDVGSSWTSTRLTHHLRHKGRDTTITSNSKMVNKQRRGPAKESEFTRDSKFIPQDYTLYQCYPNHFNPSTQIQFDLPEDSRVSITIYDILGREVIRLVDEAMEAGRYRQLWESQDRYGKTVSSGVYFMRIETRSVVSERNLVTGRKMLLIK
jgi:uncharacterized repeat protein (TIGR02543 family)